MISIITCNFNLGHLLNKTIESVLLQNKKEIECIIIDANSKDNSLEIIKKLQRKDDRVKYISEYDEGHFYGINKGLELSKGNIIGILHCSDLYEQNIFKIVNEEFLNDPDLWILGGNNTMQFKNEKRFIFKTREKYLNVKNIINFDFPAIESTFFRKEVFNEFGNFSTNKFLKRCHTNIYINYFLGVIEKKKKIKILNKNFSYHLEHDNIRPEISRDTNTTNYYSNGRKLASLHAIKKFDKLLSYKNKQVLLAQNIIYDTEKSLLKRKLFKYYTNEKKLFKIMSFIDFLRANIKIIFNVISLYYMYLSTRKVNDKTISKKKI